MSKLTGLNRTRHIWPQVATAGVRASLKAAGWASFGQGSLFKSHDFSGPAAEAKSKAGNDMVPGFLCAKPGCIHDAMQACVRVEFHLPSTLLVFIDAANVSFCPLALPTIIDGADNAAFSANRQKMLKQACTLLPGLLRMVVDDVLPSVPGPDDEALRSQWPWHLPQPIPCLLKLKAFVPEDADEVPEDASRTVTVPSCCVWSSSGLMPPTSRADAAQHVTRDLRMSSFDFWGSAGLTIASSSSSSPTGAASVAHVLSPTSAFVSAAQLSMRPSGGIVSTHMFCPGSRLLGADTSDDGASVDVTQRRARKDAGPEKAMWKSLLPVLETGKDEVGHPIEETGTRQDQLCPGAIMALKACAISEGTTCTLRAKALPITHLPPTPCNIQAEPGSAARPALPACSRPHASKPLLATSILQQSSSLSSRAANTSKPALAPGTKPVLGCKQALAGPLQSKTKNAPGNKTAKRPLATAKPKARPAQDFTNVQAATEAGKQPEQPAGACYGAAGGTTQAHPMVAGAGCAGAPLEAAAAKPRKRVKVGMWEEKRGSDIVGVVRLDTF